VKAQPFGQSQNFTKLNWASANRKADRQRQFLYAMTASGMTWDEQTLDAFLTEPTRVLPGTTMSARLPNLLSISKFCSCVSTRWRSGAHVVSG
jgi:hypothetical protein